MASDAMAPLFKRCQKDVKTYMNKLDPSHDYTHIEGNQRVLHNAEYILQQEDKQRREPYNRDVVFFAALLHDVGDRKYNSSDSVVTGPPDLVERFILDRCDDAERDEEVSAFAEKIQRVATYTSYSREMEDPSETARVIGEIPELAVVQDADRLDALGAVGIGRAFTFGQAKGRGMEDTLKHFDKKLLRLEAHMKTESGRIMARERTKRLEMFATWWEEEARA